MHGFKKSIVLTIFYIYKKGSYHLDTVFESDKKLYKKLIALSFSNKNLYQC